MMPDNNLSPMDEAAYDKALRAIDAVLNDADASSDQVEAAQASLDRITVARNNFFIGRINSRTELLNELRTQLEEVISSVRENPIGETLDRLVGAVDEVNTAIEGIGAED